MMPTPSAKVLTDAEIEKVTPAKRNRRDPAPRDRLK